MLWPEVGNKSNFHNMSFETQKMGPVQKYGNSCCVTQSSEILRTEKHSPLEMYGRQVAMTGHMYAFELSAVSCSSSELGDSTAVPPLSNLEQCGRIVLKMNISENVTVGHYWNHPLCLTIKQTTFVRSTTPCVYFKQLNFTHVIVTCFGLYVAQPKACEWTYVWR